MSDQPDDVAGPADVSVPRAFSWDDVAAEVAAELAEDEAPVAGWDVVARRLAAELGIPEPDAGPPAAGGGGPAAVGLGGAPAAPPVELEVVPEREAPVEEAVERGVQEEPELEPRQLRGGLEALLFVVDSPVDEATLAAALRCPVPRVRQELRGLAADYDERRAGVVLRRVGEGWRLYTREEHAPVVERHLLEGQRNRLTQAALETLAVIAYRQPVTRARVSAIRGVGVDAVVRTLTSRGLIREAGSDPDTGGGLYVTTPLFLERLGLTDLDELPELAPLLPSTGSLLAEHPDS